MTDSELVARSVQDPEVFGAIFDRHAETVLRFLVRRVGSEVAEGLVGETFRIAFERRAHFDLVRETAHPWLYGIAMNLLLKHRRGEQRQLRATAAVLAAQEALGAATDGELGPLDARLTLPRVAEAIGALPEPARDALLLFAWEEQSYEEIASTQGVPVGTVRSRLNRARKRLRELCGLSGKQEMRTQPTAAREERR